MSKANSYSGGTYVGEGRLAAVNTTGSATGTGDIFILGGAEFDIGLSTSAGAVSANIVNHGLLGFWRSDNSTYGGQNSGTGNVQKGGLGTLTLSGENTYSGGTTVSFGTLLVANASSSGTGSGPVTVNSDATLGGTGTIAGPVSNAGVVAPGASAGTLHMLDDYAQSAARKLQIELGAPGSFDNLQVGGSVSLDGSLEVLLLNGYMPTSGTQFDILDFSSMSGTFSSITLPALAGGLQWRLSELCTSGSLSGGLPGDYNGNHVVDAADYSIWRKRGGSAAKYDVWRSLFGLADGSYSEVGSGSSALTPAPEPVASALVAIGALCIIAFGGDGRAQSK